MWLLLLVGREILLLLQLVTSAGDFPLGCLENAFRLNDLKLSYPGEDMNSQLSVFMNILASRDGF
jgi:hypothetical protein